MKSKNPKIATVLTALVMTFSIGFSANAESLLDLTNTYSKEGSSAILNYDPENNTYELVDGDGKVLKQRRYRMIIYRNQKKPLLP